MRVAYLGPAGTHSEEALRASSPEEQQAVDAAMASPARI